MKLSCNRSLLGTLLAMAVSSLLMKQSSSADGEESHLLRGIHPPSRQLLGEGGQVAVNASQAVNASRVLQLQEEKEFYTRTAKLKKGVCTNCTIIFDQVDLNNTGKTPPTTGIWTLIYDSEDSKSNDIEHDWEQTTLSWHSKILPGTSLTANVSSSGDGETFSKPRVYKDGAKLTKTPDGQYLKIEMIFKRKNPGDESPHLYSLEFQGFG